MTYHDELQSTVDDTNRQVMAALASYDAGQLDPDEFALLVAAFIAAGNSIAAALGDLSLAAVLSTTLHQPVAALGITRPAGDTDRLIKAARTLLATPEATTDRWERLATAEPKEAASRAYSAAIAESPHVTGWVRGLSATACQLCRWWWRDGRTWPADHRMPTHKGCTCHPEPVVQERKTA